MKKFSLCVALIGAWMLTTAQVPVKDSIQPKLLDSVTIRSYLLNISPLPLQPVDNVYIYAGKNATGFKMDGNRANLSSNVARMAFAQIPGLNVWEMDGAGTQVNVGSRGTDTHRSIEMNMRQNGYNTNSDMFGYPEDHYTPPMQAIDQIQFVRGSAALQFGPQFGGMLNYVMKTGDSTKPFGLETEQTAGANGFFNSFNAVGGSYGKWSYYAYYDNRHGDGWRPNSRFDYNSFYGSLKYQFNEKLSLRLEFSRMDYVQQIAGGLTDGQFAENAKQSFRARNYFNPEINIPAVILHYDFSPRTSLEITSHFIGGQRNSVQFINTSNIPDTVNTSLGTYNPRQVDRDYYQGFTTEARLAHQYRIGKSTAALTGGVRYFSEETNRRQKGVGTTGSDFDLTLTKPYGIDLKLHTRNYAVFAENVFNVNNRLSVTPGVRMEVIQTSIDGVINNATFPVHYTNDRNFPLLGTGIQYQLARNSQLFGNISQAYRPFIYAAVTSADQLTQIDPNMKDSKGYDVDLGYRGQFRDILQYNVTAFYVYYGDRAGQLTMTNPDNSTYLYMTNIGNCVSKGIETYFDLSLWKLFGGRNGFTDIRIFNSLSYTHARYTSGEISNSGKNVPLTGHWAEGTPEWIERGGLGLYYRSFSTNLQYSYTGKEYSDANNTVLNPTGATGIVPAYHVWDWSLSWHFLKYYHLSGGINNLANAKYFTRRINMYPGPGILPADGRSFYVSVGVKI
ncbi:MAG TPA: TonB-dependent receptor [Puia sp.]|nr:TonB-dependent receptor [Puia sp.]